MPKLDSYRPGTPSYVELVTPDQHASASFYADVFGWDITEDPLPEEAGGGVYLMGRLQGDAVCGISPQMTGPAGHPAFWGVYLTVEDVDAAAAKVAGAGGSLEAGPFDVMDLGRMAAVKDPTEARVNLWQAKGSIGTERANEPGTPIWNELVSPDVPKALEFYAQVVGTGSQTMDMGEGATYTSITDVDGRTVGGAVAPMMPDVPPHWNVYFNVTDADATAARIGELGGSTLAPNFDVPGVGRMGFFADPQGAMFAIMQAPDTQE
ncbi:MAG TPA: VOC family protein [Marmoricola sp.]|jgi:predicted enzyme related to lactoylglutathione lyase|nr:VOC family protein [Marmoricola sp.]